LLTLLCGDSAGHEDTGDKELLEEATSVKGAGNKLIGHPLMERAGETTSCYSRFVPPN
jgi:hypothetical protein